MPSTECSSVVVDGKCDLELMQHQITVPAIQHHRALVGTDYTAMTKTSLDNLMEIEIATTAYAK